MRDLNDAAEQHRSSGINADGKPIFSDIVGMTVYLGDDWCIDQHLKIRLLSRVAGKISAPVTIGSSLGVSIITRCGTKTTGQEEL